MKIDYRKVQMSDNKYLAEIIRQVFDEYNAPRKGTVYVDPTTDNLYELFKKEDSILWVATSLSIPVGCCGIFPTEGLDKNCAELVKFYLLKDYRGIGVGKHLMNLSIQSAIELGYSSIYLESLPEFDGAVSMYKKLGFKNLKEPMGNSGHPTTSIWMIKKIKKLLYMKFERLQEVIDKRILEERKVFLWDQVDDNSAKSIIDRLLYLELINPGKEIQLIINSPGGYVTSGFAIYDIMNGISSPISTICTHGVDTLVSWGKRKEVYSTKCKSHDTPT